MDYNVTYRDKDKGIQVIVSYKDLNGKWKQKSKQGFKKKSDAKRYADIIIEELKEMQKLQSKLNVENIGMTFKKFSSMLINNKSLYNEKNTIINYEKALEAFEDILDMPIKDINSMHIQNCIDKLIQHDYKPSTIKLYTQNIKSFFKAAVNPYRIIIENPFTTSEIIIPKVESNKKIKALTKLELDTLLSELKAEKKQKDYIISIIASTMGLRIGEILGLCETDIDKVRAVAHITKQWKLLDNGEYGFGKTKTTNSVRTVPISPGTLTEIIKYTDNQKIKDMQKRIFWQDKSTTASASRLRQKFIRKGFAASIHDLRHTYATMLIGNGIDVKTVASLLGDTVQMVTKTYLHTTDDMIQNAKKIIGTIF